MEGILRSENNVRCGRRDDGVQDMNLEEIERNNQDDSVVEGIENNNQQQSTEVDVTYEIDINNPIDVMNFQLVVSTIMKEIFRFVVWLFLQLPFYMVLSCCIFLLDNQIPVHPNEQQHRVAVEEEVDTVVGDDNQITNQADDTANDIDDTLQVIFDFTPRYEDDNHHLLLQDLTELPKDPPSLPPTNLPLLLSNQSLENDHDNISPCVHDQFISIVSSNNTEKLLNTKINPDKNNKQYNNKTNPNDDDDISFDEFGYRNVTTPYPEAKGSIYDQQRTTVVVTPPVDRGRCHQQEQESSSTSSCEVIDKEMCDHPTTALVVLTSHVDEVSRRQLQASTSSSEEEANGDTLDNKKMSLLVTPSIDKSRHHQRNESPTSSVHSKSGIRDRSKTDLLEAPRIDETSHFQQQQQQQQQALFMCSSVAESISIHSRTFDATPTVRITQRNQLVCFHKRARMSYQQVPPCMSYIPINRDNDDDYDNKSSKFAISNNNEHTAPIADLTSTKDKKIMEHTITTLRDGGNLNETIENEAVYPSSQNERTKYPLPPSHVPFRDPPKPPLVLPEDKPLVSFDLYRIMDQMEICKFEKTDQKRRCNLPVGFQGICCKHCNGRDGYGRYFPSFLGSFCQNSTIINVTRHLYLHCPHVPGAIRKAIEVSVQNKSLQNTISKRKFMERLWYRIHPELSMNGNGINDKAKMERNLLDDSNLDEEIVNNAALSSSKIELETFTRGPVPPTQKPLYDHLLPPLVIPEDKPLISDDLYLIMEQMVICKLKKVYQKGHYVHLPEGFRGFCCRHCKGPSGAGTYFPKSFGAFYQTNTFNTITKHLYRNCPKIPDHIRNAIENILKTKSGKKNNKRLRQFMKRLWYRIHPELSSNGIDSNITNKRKRTLSTENTSETESNNDDKDLEIYNSQETKSYCAENDSDDGIDFKDNECDIDSDGKDANDDNSVDDYYIDNNDGDKDKNDEVKSAPSTLNIHLKEPTKSGSVVTISASSIVASDKVDIGLTYPNKSPSVVSVSASLIVASDATNGLPPTKRQRGDY